MRERLYTVVTISPRSKPEAATTFKYSDIKTLLSPGIEWYLWNKGQVFLNNDYMAKIIETNKASSVFTCWIRGRIDDNDLGIFHKMDISGLQAGELELMKNEYDDWFFGRYILPMI